MRELYFEMYTRFVYNKFYFEQYRSFASRSNFAICVIACLTSLSGISGWLKLNQLSVVWVILIIVAPIFNAISKFLPFNKRISAVNYFIPELDCLIDEVEENWRNINYESPEITDSKINDLMSDYQKKFTEMDHRYLKDDLFPDDTRLAKKAAKTAVDKRDRFFKNKYGVDFYEQQESSSEAALAMEGTVETGKKSSI